MRTKKLGVILLALLLAAMAMVPVAGAANQYDDEKLKLAESNYIPVDKAYQNALTTMQNFAADGALDEKWSGATLGHEPLAIYDLNGAVLAYQFAAEKDGVRIGEVNAAASSVLGGSVLSIGSEPKIIDEKKIEEKIRESAGAEGKEVVIVSKTLVAYNFPHLGELIILTNPKTGQTRRIVIDAYDYTVVREKRDSENEPGAWSYYDRLSIDQMNQNARQADGPQVRTNALMYASQKLLGVTRSEQLSENWCAVTVAQMISQYYGHTRTQQAIANVMGNGGGGGSTPAMELTYYWASTGSGGLGKINSDDADTPYTTWYAAADEIDAYRPLKVGNLGHARTISGYKIVGSSSYLYINDPGVNWGSYWEIYSSPYGNYVYVR
jgi:hypothetical protein